MALLAAIEPILADLLKQYDLVPPLMPFTIGAQGINNTTRGLHTGAGDVIWKLYAAHRDADVLLYEHHLLAWLSSQGLPFAVPLPLSTRTGKTLFTNALGTHALFPKLPGRPPDRGNPYQAAAIGVGLAQLHQALSGYPTTTRPGMLAYGDLECIHPRISDPFTLTTEDIELPDTPEHATFLNWWRNELAELRGFITGPYRALPWQVIHGDFAPANTLFEDEPLTAILDFEFATPDARAMDVAAGLVFILRIWEGEPHWEAADAFLSGYQQIMRLRADERAALPWLIRLRNAASATWWFGRDLERGHIENIATRIGDMREMVTVLERHRERIQQVVATPGNIIS